MKSITSFLVLILLFFTANIIKTAPKDNPDGCVGYWLNGDGRAKIQIYKSGNTYSGKIVWLSKPNDKDGKPRVDKQNPDTKLRNRTIVGLDILHSFVYDGDNTWIDGRIYDPENGKTYKCKMTLKDYNTLDVRGYIGISLIGRTDTWKRVKL